MLSSQREASMPSPRRLFCSRYDLLLVKGRRRGGSSPGPGPGRVQPLAGGGLPLAMTRPFAVGTLLAVLSPEEWQPGSATGLVLGRV